MSKTILFSGTRNASSWALRAWLSLRAAGIEFEEVVVDIRRPQRFANLASIATISPSVSVPVLVVDGQAIFDSIAIMEYANDTYGGRLLPSETVERARARSLMAWQHAGLSHICGQISFESAFYPYKRALSTAEQREASRLFVVLEKLLDASRDDYLFGEAGLADFMLAPTAIRLARHRVDTTNFPYVARWLAAIESHEYVREWLAEADALPHIWYDEYLLPDTPRALFRAEEGASVSEPPRT